MDLEVQALQGPSQGRRAGIVAAGPAAAGRGSGLRVALRGAGRGVLRAGVSAAAAPRAGRQSRLAARGDTVASWGWCGERAEIDRAGYSTSLQ